MAAGKLALSCAEAGRGAAGAAAGAVKSCEWKLKRRVNALIEDNYWQALSFTFTIVALFLDPLRDAALDKASDPFVNLVIFVSLVFFVVEMVLLSFAQKGYFGSFFFFLDLAGTVSLVLDIPWLFNDLFPPENHAHIGMASGAKAARGVS